VTDGRSEQLERPSRHRRRGEPYTRWHATPVRPRRERRRPLTIPLLVEVLGVIVLGAGGLFVLRVGLGLPHDVTLALLATLAVGWSVSLFWRDRLQRTAPAAPPPPRYEVRCDDDAISVLVDGVPRGAVRWDDILLVGIRIDGDAILPEPWWWLTGTFGECFYPNEAAGWQDAHRQMARRLSGFDHAAVIEAMGMASGGVVVWKRTI
jgi:hypothetical protein